MGLVRDFLLSILIYILKFIRGAEKLRLYPLHNEVDRALC